MMDEESITKADWYDSDVVLSKWGFTDSRCHCCGVLNSDLDGLLMQCGKCKKAYYCSMKCFNKHLPVHNKYCVSKEIYSEPKGTKLELLPIDYYRKPIVDADSMKKQSIEPEQEDKPAEESNEDSEQEEAIVEILETLSHSEDDEDGNSSGDAVRELMNDSFESLGRSNSSIGLPEREEFSREEIELRHAEMLKREYSWQKPDWIGSPLRSTAHGKVMKTKGDLANPVTNAAVLLEKGEISWEKPEWMNAKLRSTPHSAMKKQMVRVASDEIRKNLTDVPTL